jgi:hypothetical protein
MYPAVPASFYERSARLATKSISYSVGQLVEHPLRPQWGPGRVVAVEAGRVYVFFRDDLENKAKVILTDVVALQICDNQNDEALAALAEPKFDGQAWVLPKPKVSKRRTKEAVAST